MAAIEGIRALTFDVDGAVLNWHSAESFVEGRARGADLTVPGFEDDPP